MQTDIAVKFSNVWKSYPSYTHVTGGIKNFIFHLPQAIKGIRQRRAALEDVDFTIHKGEKFAIIGNNGAGKSTILGLIAGVLAADKGQIQVNGRVSPLLELGAGFHPELSGRANILLNGVLLGLSRQEVLAHEQEIIDFSGLGDFIDQPVRTYSSGMYAKLGFAMVTQLKPEILLLDEILAVGDITFQQKCQDTFNKFRNNPDITMILVSHNLASVIESCDRAVWIDGKTVKMLGQAKDVVAAYKATNTPPACSPTQKDKSNGFVSIDINCSELDCSESSAVFFPLVKALPADTSVQISLFQFTSEKPACQWQIIPEQVALNLADDSARLRATSGECPTIFPNKVSSEALLDPTQPLILQIEIADPTHTQEFKPTIWLPVSATKHAKSLWQKVHKEFWTSAGYPLAQQNERTVRVIAKELTSHDEVTQLLLDVTSSLQQKDLPVRIYAFSFSRALAGIVSPFATLETELTPKDILFYHLSSTPALQSRITHLAHSQLSAST